MNREMSRRCVAGTPNRPPRARRCVLLRCQAGSAKRKDRRYITAAVTYTGGIQTKTMTNRHRGKRLVEIRHPTVDMV